MHRPTIILLLMLTLVVCSCARHTQRFEYNRVCMGVQTRIVLYASNDSAARDAAGAAFDRINHLDDLCSDYRLSSDLSRINDAAARADPHPVTVAPELCDLLLRSAAISLATDGAFDATAGPSVSLWRNARRTHTLPSQDQLNPAVSLSNWRDAHIDAASHSVLLTRPGMRLDLGGIAKGYAAQQAILTLRARGIPVALVALSGDIALGDPPPGHPGWRIDVESIVPSQPPRTLLLSNTCISTSGDANQFVEIDGRRYSHIVDPATGLGLTHHMTITVISPRGEIADALPTALCVTLDRADHDAPRRILSRYPDSVALLQWLDGAGTPHLTTVGNASALRWLDTPPTPEGPE